MTQKDLQIGDWVYNHRKWECPILSIRRDYDSEQYYVMVIARHYGEEEFRVEDLSPIPLTPEILEKNGFVRDEKDEEMYYWNWKISDNCVSYDKETGIVRIFHVFGHLVFALPLSYVHELQHALRLCGIEKEIIL